MNRRWNNPISGIVIVALLSMPLVNPLALAADEDWANLSDEQFEQKMSENCGDVLRRVEAGEKTDNDSKASYCVKAEIARKSANWEKQKAWLIFAGAGTAMGFYGIELLGRNQRYHGIKEKLEAETSISLETTKLKGAEFNKVQANLCLKEAYAAMALASATPVTIAAAKLKITTCSQNLKIAMREIARCTFEIEKQTVARAKAITKYETGINNISRARKTCPALGVATVGSGFLFDKYGMYQIQEVKLKYGQSAENPLNLGTIMGAAGVAGMVGKIIKNNNVPLFPKKEEVLANLDELKGADQYGVDSIEKLNLRDGISREDFRNDASQKRSHCFKIAAALGVYGGVIWNSKKGLEAEARNNVKTAATIKLEQAGTTRVSVASVLDNKSTAKSPSSPGSTGSILDPCAKSKDYLNCAAKQSPEIAAITNNRGFMKTLQDELGGKTIGEHLRNNKGGSEREFAQSLAGALGASPTAIASLIQENTKNAAKAAEFVSAEGTVPQLASYGGSAGLNMPRLGGRGVHAEPDFGKLLNGLLPDMNSNQEQSATEPSSPTEEAYRRLDLMAADTIQTNKDISLFVRVAYRYRKHVEKSELGNSEKDERVPSSVKK